MKSSIIIIIHIHSFNQFSTTTIILVSTTICLCLFVLSQFYSYIELVNFFYLLITSLIKKNEHILSSPLSLFRSSSVSSFKFNHMPTDVAYLFRFLPTIIVSYSRSGKEKKSSFSLYYTIKSEYSNIRLFVE